MRSVLQLIYTSLMLLIVIGCGGVNQQARIEPGTETPASMAGEAGSGEPANPNLAPPAVVGMSVEEKNDLLTQARQLAADGDIAGAESQLKDLLLQSEDSDAEEPDRFVAEARYNLGVLAEWQGKETDARRHYEAALNENPAFGMAVVAIGRLLLRNGEKAAALNYAQGRLVKQPKSAALRNALNRLRIAANADLQKVETDSKLVLREDEKNVAAMVNLAAYYAGTGKYELSIAVLRNAREIQKTNREIMYRLSLAHQALGEKLEARLALEDAVKLPGGGTAEIHNNLGIIYHIAGDFPGAEGQYRKALARWPTMLEAQVNLANALKGQQKYAEAKAAMDTSLAQAPNSPDVNYNLGILLLDGQIPDMDPIVRLQKAITHLEKYKQTSREGGKAALANDYIAEAQKRIEVEKKRQEQMRNQPKEPAGGGDDDDDDDFGDMDDDDDDFGDMDDDDDDDDFGDMDDDEGDGAGEGAAQTDAETESDDTKNADGEDDENNGEASESDDSSGPDEDAAGTDNETAETDDEEDIEDTVEDSDE